MSRRYSLLSPPRSNRHDRDDTPSDRTKHLFRLRLAEVLSFGVCIPGVRGGVSHPRGEPGSQGNAMWSCQLSTAANPLGSLRVDSWLTVHSHQTGCGEGLSGHGPTQAVALCHYPQRTCVKRLRCAATRAGTSRMVHSHGMPIANASRGHVLTASDSWSAGRMGHTSDVRTEGTVRV